MSEAIDDGGSAFPAKLPGGNYCTPGMSLLDWFAGQALAAIIQSGANESANGDSADAYMYAIAMLNERERINAIKS